MNLEDRDLAMVQEKIGYSFHDPALLESALTHRSYAHEAGHERREVVDHYERLEFLGDAILGFFAAKFLFELDPAASEGVLTRRKQIVVRAETLTEIAEKLELGPVMRLGKGERSTGGEEKASLLADVFEAVLGAVYLDGGMEPAGDFIRRHLGVFLGGATRSTAVHEDYKTRFQELVQQKLRITPAYRIVSRSGPDHSLQFFAEAMIGNETVGSGEGSSRKKAEQMAAVDALKRWENRE